ncbi:MAG: Rne/Rng family ribonuclease [Deltaproteobacteria bacterium]|nr:Rne/Rng family ribonuclease [Deltaproteobacteria bacterium]MBW2051382.1 Rne/Rng family ribonuclease [Deltaproteobacteria bacterium]MBW2141281.1 Rne/Rng family ribonuclease [Deltaproteobacteria bacterium]MBW2322729.1 Rne/Rng family ribonuclease [Deltaproteobacteria bacterium]
MLINASDSEEYRVAIVEDGHLEEFYTDSSIKEQARGNIYKGTIVNIESGLQAAFVDFGAQRNGFLQINDLHPEYFQEDPPERGFPAIQKALLKGQELLVQVTKEASGNKGAALTTYISMAGRYIVLAPGRDNIGVSRTIEDEDERKRLKSIVKDLLNREGFGIIVRTAAEGRNKREITRDLNHMLRLWEEIRRKVPDMPSPSLIHKEHDLALRTIRDYFTPEIKEILIDDADVYNNVRAYMKVVAPRSQSLVKRYKEKRPILSKYQIEEQIQAIFSNEVKLKSGGAIVINPTEALVAIDVNSGRATREVKLEDTAFKTNVEAAGEICRQLRLRDLGGLIVVDFIDMRERSHIREVEKTMRAESKKDKAKIALSRISRFGLLELSRQRLRPPIEHGTYYTCEACGGRGVVRSPEATALAVIRTISQKVSKGRTEKVQGRLHPAVAGYLLNQKRQELLKLEDRFNVFIELKGDQAVMPGQIDLEFTRRKSESEDPGPVTES